MLQPTSLPLWALLAAALIALLLLPVILHAASRTIRYRENPLPLVFIPLTGLVIGIGSKLVCPFAVALGLVFVRLGWFGGGWDVIPTQDGEGVRNHTLHGDMPVGFRWTETVDKRIPGDFHEPALAEWYDRGERLHPGFGKYLATWYWLGTRNTAMRLACYFGRDTGGYLHARDGYQCLPDGIWRYELTLPGGFGLGFGYNVWGIGPHGAPVRFMAGPTYSIKRP